MQSVERMESRCDHRYLADAYAISFIVGREFDGK